MLTARQLIELLRLEPLAQEGGYYREAYRAAEKIPQAVLPSRYSTDKAFSTAIYYLLTPGTFSAMHRLLSDEVFHFYLGQPVTMLLLFDRGDSGVFTLGWDLRAGQHLQVVVPRGTWMGALLEAGGEYALLGTTVAPGFDFADYEHGCREDLLKAYPSQQELIVRLTRSGES